MTSRFGRRGTIAVAMAIAALAVGCGADAAEHPTDDAAFGYRIDALPQRYALCAATAPSELTIRSDDDVTLVVYGDTSSDDPYAGPVYGVASFSSSVSVDELGLGSAEALDLRGTPARLGGADGLQLARLPDFVGRVLTWADGDRTVQLIVRNDDDADLVALSDSVRIGNGSASIDSAALPDGFGSLGDIFELEGQLRTLFRLDHQLAAGDDLLTLVGAAGDTRAMEAARFGAVDSARTAVDGAPAVIADLGVGGEGPWQLSWMPEDDVVLRLFSFALRHDELVDLAASVVRLDHDEWQAWLGEIEGSRCAR